MCAFRVDKPEEIPKKVDLFERKKEKEEYFIYFLLCFFHYFLEQIFFMDLNSIEERKNELFNRNRSSSSSRSYENWICDEK